MRNHIDHALLIGGKWLKSDTARTACAGYLGVLKRQKRRAVVNCADITGLAGLLVLADPASLPGLQPC